MRPKKKVLVYSADENELGRVGYLLWVWQMQPVLVATPVMAIRAARREVFDGALVLGTCEPDLAQKVVWQIVGVSPDLRVALFAEAGTEIDPCLPALVRLGASNAEMMQALRVLVARKRGPKKASEPRGYLTSDLQRVG